MDGSAIVGQQERQGRLASSGWVPTEGTYAFVLGVDQSTGTQTLAIGDFVQVLQICQPPVGAKYLHLRAHIRGPSEMPIGTEWQLTARIDDVAHVTRVIAPAQEREIIDWWINVAHLSAANHEFAFRLELSGGGLDPSYDVELPGVYIDGLLWDTTATRPRLVNRDPEPGELDVRVDANISVDITDVGADGISLADSKIYVDDVLAFDAGTFQAGFTGPGSAYSSPQAFTLRVVIDPVTTLLGTSTHTVRVLSKTATSLLPIDETYTFSTEDLNAPTATLTVLSNQTISALFDEAVSGADDPGSYMIVLVPPTSGFKAAAPVQVAAVSANGSEYTLTLDVEMTPGAVYRLSMAGIEDANGNAVDPDVTYDLVGPDCYQVDGREFDLLRMLPGHNLADDETEDLQRFVAIVQEVTDLQLCDIDRFPEILDPDTAADKFVRLMLVDMGDPFNFPLDEQGRRRLVQLLVPIYRQKGTDAGIINAIRLLLGIEVTITTPTAEILGLGVWTLGGTWVLGSSELRDRLTFVVNVPFTLTDEQFSQMDRIIDYMKYAPTHHVYAFPPAPPSVPNHLELGLSKLGLNWILH